MSYLQLHESFKLNGESFASVDELIQYAKNNQPTIFKFLVQWFSSDNVISVSTSGSTGEPSVVELSKDFMVNSALATGSYFNLMASTTALLCLSVDYIAGKMMLVRALVLGWELDVIEADSSPLKTVTKRYDFSAMVPLQVLNSLEKLHTIEKLIVGGGPVSTALQSQLMTLNTQIFATYGMTETITHIAVRELNSKETNIGSSVYQTLSGIFISQDERGCLIIDAPTISKEPVVTNDVVRIVSDSEFEWLGRFDSVVNSGGIKLHPEQIEEKLSGILLSRYFVAGIIDEVLGEKLILVVEGKQNDLMLTKIEKLNTLGKFEKPKEIYFLKEFVETATKKIQRKKTLDLISGNNS